MNVCPKCGLPEQACVCGEIGKSEQKIKIETIKRKYGKTITLVSGFNKNVNIKDTAKELKHTLACGGTIKNGIVELQGDHKSKVKPALVGLGFNAELIEEI